MESLHPMKLLSLRAVFIQLSAGRTMHNFADHKFATLLKGLTSALENSISGKLRFAKWRVSFDTSKIYDRAMVNIRATKGYDLLGARMMYRVCKFHRSC